MTEGREMSGTNLIFRILSKLQSDDPVSRDEGASEAADWFESGHLSEGHYKTLVQELLAKGTAEPDPVAKESLFNALSSASMCAMNQTINWEPVTRAIAGLDLQCLEHALVILGFSKNPKYRSEIERYLTHPDPDICRIAAESLEENRASPARRSV